jgi:hypothetical protein
MFIGQDLQDFSGLTGHLVHLENPVILSGVHVDSHLTGLQDFSGLTGSS